MSEYNNMQKLSTEEKRANPIDTASLFSLVFYKWLTPLIDLGAERPLEFDDVFLPPAAHQTKAVYNLFQNVWKDELTAAPNEGAHRMGKMLLTCCKRNFIASVIAFCVFALISLLQPFFVVKVLDYVSNGETSFIGIESGVLLSVGLGLWSLIGVIGFSVGFTQIQECGFRIRNILISSIFGKSLKISSSARSKQTTGEVVTLMSADTERIWMFVLMSTWLWLSPIVIFVSLLLLIVEFGMPAIVVSIVVAIWFTAFSKTSTMVGKYRSIIVKLTGERVKLMNEALQGIRVIKLYSWETPTAERIEHIRSKETKFLMRYQLTKMFNTVLQFVAPSLIASSLFLSVYVLGGSLTVAKVYHGLSLLNVLRLPLAIFPITLTAYKEALKSHQRIKDYLDAPNTNTMKLMKIPDGSLIEIKGASFSWSEVPPTTIEENPMSDSLVQKDGTGAVLKNVDLCIHEGDFIALVGEVGSGKTSLITALLGQLTLLTGEHKTNAKIAYASQESWIQNISLRDNVLFGSPMDHDRYVEVLDASQLSQDLLTLPNADDTEIGERGMNLSGGQKARVNVARALYASDIDLYLFDDPLSAVDVHVGKELFQHAFLDMLRDKARVVSLSSNYHFLSRFDKIIVALDGTIAICNSYSELRERFPQYAVADDEDSPDSTVNDDTTTRPPSERGVSGLRNSDKTQADSNSFVTVDDGEVDRSDVDAMDVEDGDGNDRCSDDLSTVGVEMTTGPSLSLSPRRQRMTKGHSIYMQQRDSILSKQQSGKVLTSAEDKQTGAVTLSTYAEYFSFATTHSRNPQLAGAATLFIIFVLFAIAQVGRVVSDLWPGLWAADQEKEHSEVKDRTWFTWYVVILLVMLVFSFGRAAHLVASCVWANVALHSSLVAKVFAAPINTYFDITPLGRILNRFSKDLDMLDSILPDFFLQNVQNLFHIVAVLVMCSISSAFFAILVPFLALLFYYIYNHFRKTSRELKRFDGVTRSPVYSSFGEMLNGISTIRAYRRESAFFDKFCAIADENFRYFSGFYYAGRWLALRLDLLSNLVILFVSLIAVLIVDYGGDVNENMLGLALVYSLQLMGMLQWTVRVTIETENNMTAAERLLKFNTIDSEAPGHMELDPTPDEWPSEGHIVMKNLSMRYRPGLDKVLDGVHLDIPGGCKVGVCGRTGAGKSSLMLALFRIVEPEAGSVIRLDGRDILTMGLEILRSQLTIIPQDPVMFSGSLRYNLDPFGKYSDLDIWEALGRAHLKDEIVQKFPRKLDHVVSERGENISVGQKQLLCIARALLRKPKVIIMDEATASVDSATDKRIQDTIREAFHSCTILTIAHRLETIADYDRIVVMNSGRVAEYASPHELLQKPGGLFRNLVDQLGPKRKEAFENVALMRHRNA